MSEETTTINAVDFTFRIVDELQQRDGASITDLAATFDVSKSTIHRHLATLRDHGYVTKEDGSYDVGLRFLEPGMYARTRKRVYALAGEKVEEIAEQTGERAQFIVEENGHGVHVHSAIGENGVRTETGVGVRVPMYATSAGKAMLAHMPDERVAEILDTHGLQELTENTISDRAAFEAELAEVREEGIAYNRAERIDGVFSVGVPICSDDRVYGGLSVTGPTRRMTEDRVDELSERLLGLAEEIQLKIEYSEI
jgi:DNA-binding IclR family transcriptional regulator